MRAEELIFEARFFADDEDFSWDLFVDDIESEITERNKRLAAQPRDLTAAFFGDPVPGFSARQRFISWPERRDARKPMLPAPTLPASPGSSLLGGCRCAGSGGCNRSTIRSRGFPHVPHTHSGQPALTHGSTNACGKVAKWASG